MDITGKIVHVSPTQQVSDKFCKREIVLEHAPNPQYPEVIKFEFVQDKCELLDGFQVGQEAQVWFNLKGRKWTNREGREQYFTTLQGWRIQPADGAQQQAPAEPYEVPQIPVPPQPEADPIPF